MEQTLIGYEYEGEDKPERGVHGLCSNQLLGEICRESEDVIVLPGQELSVEGSDLLLLQISFPAKRLIPCECNFNRT